MDLVLSLDVAVQISPPGHGVSLPGHGVHPRSLGEPLSPSVAFPQHAGARPPDVCALLLSAAVLPQFVIFLLHHAAALTQPRDAFQALPCAAEPLPAAYLAQLSVLTFPFAEGCRQQDVVSKMLYSLSSYLDHWPWMLCFHSNSLCLLPLIASQNFLHT